MAKSIRIKLLFLLVVIGVGFVLCSCNDKSTIEKRAVRRCFEDYKKSIIEGRYEQTADFIDKKTLQYYNNIAEMARFADSTSISKLKIMDQIAILLTRVTANQEQIKSFNGRSIFNFFIKNDFVNKEGMLNVWIAEVEIEGNFAIGQIDSKKLKELNPNRASRKKENPFVHFYKEDGKWKMNLLSMLKLFEPLLQKALIEKKQSIPDFLFDVSEEQTGKRPNSDIWFPIVKEIK